MVLVDCGGDHHVSIAQQWRKKAENIKGHRHI